MRGMNTLLVAAAAGLLVAGGPVLAHEGGHRRHGAAVAAQQPWGILGHAKDARRAIEVVMTDDMRFTPSAIEVTEGETVRFLVRNNGKMLHEMVLGTKKSLDEHALAMQKAPDMAHDEPHSVHVAAGKSGEIVWKFNRAGDFDFACLIPGHYQAGMVGKIRVKPAGGASK